MNAPGRISILIILFLFGLQLNGQTVIVRPEKPGQKRNIDFTYTPAKVPGQAESVSLEILYLMEKGRPIVEEVAMEKDGSAWKAEVTPNEAAVSMLFHFVSGELTDDNGGKSWDLLMYNAEGRPLEFAHLTQAYTLSVADFYGFKRPGDIQRAMSEIRAELELYPDNTTAHTTRWQLLMKEENQAVAIGQVKSELDAVFERNRNDEQAVASLLPWYDQTGQTQRADDIRADAIEANPRGAVAESIRLRAVFDEQDRRKRADLYEAFRADFPKAGQEKIDSDLQLFRMLVASRQHDRAKSLLETIPSANGDHYNSLAWGMIEAGEDLETGVMLAKTGVDLYAQSTVEDKPAYMTRRTWEENRKYGLGQVADTYAYGLEQLGRMEEAEKAYELAYENLDGMAADVNERMVGCYVKTGHYQKAIEVSTTCIEKGYSTDGLVTQFREAFLKNGGSETEFATRLESAREVARAGVRKKMIEERVNEPAIEFALEKLGGGTVKLSELKGKVVVVDFWATWCGPCLQSFPYLQRVYDHYKENRDVVILTLNTWENKKGEARVEHVKKFMQDNKYTFPVLFDETTVNAYKVEGIPTKFLIDRNGYVQFKSIGFEGGQKMLDEMMIQIDLLLSKEFYSMKF